MFKLLQVLAFSALVFVSACSDKDSETGRKLEKLFIQSGDSQQVYNIEVANTKETLYHGLMGRSSLAEDSGLLLDTTIVPKDLEIAMWMKDTLIPLDMLFIDENGIIYFIYENAEPNSTKAIRASQRPHAVLEINAGQVKKHGIKTGDKVKAKLFDNL